MRHPSGVKWRDASLSPEGATQLEPRVTPGAGRDGTRREGMAHLAFSP
jgi:hypothetical protein